MGRRPKRHSFIVMAMRAAEQDVSADFSPLRSESVVVGKTSRYNGTGQPRGCSPGRITIIVPCGDNP